MFPVINCATSLSVSNKSQKNKMSVFNLGVVFGPTLLRAVEETLAAILDIKFNNVVIEILIENYDLIFKNAPNKASEYLAAHSSPPEPVPRTYYRSSRNSLTSQPVVRVVTRANYTDTVMSSSLQNIPNGLAIYQNTTAGSGGSKVPKNHHPIYDTKPQMNQSTPTLNRDLNMSGRSGAVAEATYISAGSHHNLSPNHRSVDHHNSSKLYHQQNHVSSREKLMHSSGGGRVAGDTNHSNPSMTRSSGDGIYSQTQRLTFSENNLSHPASSIIDRINSTSSSNESVCSTSSLNHSYGRHTTVAPPSQLASTNYLADYGTSGGLNNSGGLIGSNNYGVTTTIRDEVSQSYLPKKTQRTKEIGRQLYNSPRDNV